MVAKIDWRLLVPGGAALAEDLGEPQGVATCEAQLVAKAYLAG